MDVVTEKIVKYCRHCTPNYKDERLTIVGIFDNGKLNVGISRCSNKDQFEKKKGHEIAYGRAEKCPVLVIATTTPKKSFTTVYREIEEQFNNKDEREQFLSFIKQSPQEEKTPRKQGVVRRIIESIKEIF